MVYVIFGSPCSGKSTYVKNRMGYKDIICDIDEIYSAITGHDSHDGGTYGRDVAFNMMGSMFDMIHDRIGTWNDAYVITTANTEEQIKKMVERVRADEVIFMDTPYAECMNRANGRPFFFEWAIAEWFANRGEIDVKSINHKIKTGQPCECGVG